jgi:Fe-S oxidoreductase
MAYEMAIHDPCYLGRANDIFEPLRDIGKALPGLHLSELTRNRENGFCCGGGGGRIWMHDALGRHINHLRAEEIQEAGVEIVATACPYCVSMLDDGIKALETPKPPKVLDMIEIVASSIG